MSEKGSERREPFILSLNVAHSGRPAGLAGWQSGVSHARAMRIDAVARARYFASFSKSVSQSVRKSDPDRALVVF